MPTGALDATTGLAQSHSLFDMVSGSGPVVFGVLILLIVLSVGSWAITISKSLHFKRAQKDSKEFTALFWETRNLARVEDSSRRLAASPLVQVFSAGYRELARTLQQDDLSNADLLATVERALSRAEYEEAIKLERGITFLATVASAAPFIGLFGTVWGIMNAFHGLSSPGASTTIQSVAPGISEALVATAIGLAAAIPAAVAYNYFAVALRQFREGMARFSSDFVQFARQGVVK